MLTDEPTPKESRILNEHFNYLKDLADRGSVILAGRTLNTDPSSFGIVIISADSEEEARTIMEQDPAVKYGVMQSKLFPYRVALIAKPKNE